MHSAKEGLSIPYLASQKNCIRELDFICRFWNATDCLIDCYVNNLMNICAADYRGGMEIIMKDDFSFKTVENLKRLLKKRIRMLHIQGYDIDAEDLQKQAEELPMSLDSVFDFAVALNPTKYRKDFPYVEPYEQADIEAQRPEGARDILPNLENCMQMTIRDKIYGGVYGRIAGCILGKPFEMGWTSDMIKEYLEGVDAWPLNDYVPPFSPTQKCALRGDCIPSMKGHIQYAQPDDDINYLMLGLRVMEDHGIDFTPQNMLSLWRANLPLDFTWSSEHLIYRMSAFCDQIPTGEAWEQMRYMFNEGEESIGAMIRADAFGLVSPGKPLQAARLAWRDASITHKKTGMYAEQWAAATISAAFMTSDPAEAIKAGIEQLPRKSRYAEALREALKVSCSHENWIDSYNYINNKWGHLGHAGTLNESAAIINSLVHSIGEDHLVDYEKAICLTVMHGWDTDCSGATAGCIAGVLAGYHAIPDKWLAPLQDTFYTAVASECNTRISSFAERMYQMYRVVNK